MKAFFRYLALLLAGTGSVAAQQPAATVAALADQYLAQYFTLYPEYGTFYGVANADNSRLSDNSAAGVQRRRAMEATLLRQLETVDLKKLAPGEAHTYAVLHEQLAADLGCRVCRGEWWAVDQVGGWPIFFIELAHIQPVGSEPLRAQTLARWQLFPLYVRRDIDNLREGLRHGYSAPKQNVRLVLAQVTAMLAQPVRSSGFYAPARRDSTPAFVKALHRVVEQKIYPALRTYQTFLTTEYLGRAREAIGVSALPQGAACYQALLRQSTSLAVQPEAVYAAGLAAVAEREAKVRELGQRLYGTQDLQTVRQRLRQDTAHQFATTEALLQFSNEAVQRAKAKLPAYFSHLPTIQVEIIPMPAFEQAGTSHYNPASDDGKQPAIYYIQTAHAAEQDKAEAERTAFHETYPGHHLQFALAREQGGTPPLSKYVGNSGFDEGWARYAETLADEMGLYSSPRSQLSAYAGLPTGMVVDPGIHAKNWTRDQAIAYVLATQSNKTRQYAEVYVDRIAIWPGQMATYGMGEVFFWQLRRQAQAQLGSHFDLKAFHNACLELGSVPLNELERHVQEWIQKTLAGIARCPGG